MKLPRRRPTAPPMPLWLQGVFELGQAALISAALVLIPIAAVWLTGGFADRDAASAAQSAGHAWLVMHGVPLVLTFPPGTVIAGTTSGLLHAVPLGLVLVPFLLAWRAGRRLARASYTDQLWQAVLGALGIYALVGAAAAYFSTNAEVTVPLVAGALIPPVSAGLGIVTGAYREAGAWSRLIGVDLASWIARTSQHSRWAGSYAWSVVRSAFLGVVAATGLSAVLFAAAVVLHWADVITVYERLEAGIAGSTALTLGQLGLLPNLVLWTLAWASGAGFALGAGSSLTPLASTVGPLPAVPVLGALPAGAPEYGLAALALPVVAGLLAGWWFFREGENHFDEWLSLKTSARWLTSIVSTVCLGLFVGLLAGLGGAALALLSRASLGIGRLTDLGPDPLAVALWLGAEVGLGAVLGYAVAPLLEREPQRRDA
ncbi:cell division protein PerM [Arthrobacter sp. TMN-37]